MPRKKRPEDATRRTGEEVKRDFDQRKQKATGTAAVELADVRLSEVLNTLWGWGSEDPAKIAKVINVIDMMDELAPRDAYERMLVHQMMAIHNAAMECFRRAMIPGQAHEARDSNLKHGQKLSAMYAMQLEALNKHRGKVQQKVTVEHVHVAAGGQAIVGNLDSGTASAPVGRRRVAPPQIEHQVPVRLPIPEAEGVKAKQGVKSSHG